MTRRGFTLIELVLSIGASAVLLTSLSGIFSALREAETRQREVSEVEAQGMHAMRVMAQIVRNADAILGPAAGTTGVEVLLTAGGITTRISLAAGLLTITEGASPGVPLTSSRVAIGNLQFSNFSRPNTPGVIRIGFTLTSVRGGSQSREPYAAAFYGSAALR